MPSLEDTAANLNNDVATSIPHRRTQLLWDWGLLADGGNLVFEEATQLASQSIDAAVCILGFATADQFRIKSIVGLAKLEERFSLPPDHYLPLQDCPCSQVLQTSQTVMVENMMADPSFAKGRLVQSYGIKAYLGVPLLTPAKLCLGVLEVIDFQPKQFTLPEIQLLEMIARWCMSEVERRQLLLRQPAPPTDNANVLSPHKPAAVDTDPSPTRSDRSTSFPSLAKFELLTLLSQELRSPLTPVMGMTSVLRQEIYGTLTSKQREYLDVIYQSGQTLLNLVNEITDLNMIDENNAVLNGTAVDLEMLCQQAISTLTLKTQQREQQLRLTVDSGCRIGQVDREKARQLIYHLISGVTLAANPGSTICIHIARAGNTLRISVWATHPWLGDGLRQSDLITQHLAPQNSGLRSLNLASTSSTSESKSLDAAVKDKSVPKKTWSQDVLRIMLSRRLAAMHGGKVSLQGSAESGFRFIASLPELLNSESDPNSMQP
jgi:signal transduction histidine kinase